VPPVTVSICVYDVAGTAGAAGRIRCAASRREPMLWLILFAIFFYYLILGALYFAALALVVLSLAAALLGLTAAALFGASIGLVHGLHDALKLRSNRAPIWPAVAAGMIFFGLPVLLGGLLVGLLWSLTPFGILVLPVGIAIAFALPALFVTAWCIEHIYPQRVAAIRARVRAPKREVVRDRPMADASGIDR
jgi:hypothetical protein